MQPRISFSVDSLLGRKTTSSSSGDSSDPGDIKLRLLTATAAAAFTDLDRNDNQRQVFSREPPITTIVPRGDCGDNNADDDNEEGRRNSWDALRRGTSDGPRLPLLEMFRHHHHPQQQQQQHNNLANGSLNDSAGECIKEEEEEEEEEEEGSDAELCVDGDEEEEEGYEEDHDDPDPRGEDSLSPPSTGRLHPVMPTPLLGRPQHPHPLAGLHPGLLRPPWGGHGGHLSLPFGSSLFDNGKQKMFFMVRVRFQYIQTKKKKINQNFISSHFKKMLDYKY